MEDTAPAVKQLALDIILSKTAEERLLMCAEMYEEAKEFARIGMPADLTTAEEEAYIFRRIHGVTPIESVGHA